jgi:rare lipoprotein A
MPGTRPAAGKSRLAAICAALLLVCALAGCARRKAKIARPAPAGRYSETGLASWYGVPYHGRAAANGEIYDMEKMTAAHRTLPFDTVVRVTNLSNTRTVEVRITDRGPFIDGRIIDLSRAAAREIDMLGPGVVNVRVDAVRMGASAPRAGSETGFTVQVGAFRDRTNAERLQRELARRYHPVEITSREAGGRIWRVRVGHKATVSEAQLLASELAKEREKVFVVRID